MLIVFILSSIRQMVKSYVLCRKRNGRGGMKSDLVDILQIDRSHQIQIITQ
jgi:hypothetical protein